jgi:hypothetical protein
MGSGGSKKTTQKYTPATYIEEGAQQSAALAKQYAAQPWQAYNRDRVAGLSTNEQAGIDLAGASVGAGQKDLTSARGALNTASGTFNNADIQSYMNPYIKGALDPAAREMRINAAQRQAEVTGQQASVGALSGSRAVLQQSEANKNADQSLSDLYATGYANAFDKGAALWESDQNRQIQVANGFMQAAGMGQEFINQDYKRLMDSGEVQRSVDQLKKDFDYSQFIEKRDWGGRQALYLADTLRTLKGSFGETTTSKTKEKGDMVGQVIGAVATVAAAYFTGGAALAASDRSLKRNVVRIGHLKSSGLPVYTYVINGFKSLGCMADEVEQQFPEAVHTNTAGTKMVNYHVIDFFPENLVFEKKEAA